MARNIPPRASRARFSSGKVCLTPGVDALAREGRLDPVFSLRRHLAGDWGDVCDDDRRRNNAALKSGERLFSSYELTPGEKLWIVTEYDRSVTTLMLPDEY
jgi:hypothetical protein